MLPPPVAKPRALPHVRHAPPRGGRPLGGDGCRGRRGLRGNRGGLPGRGRRDRAGTRCGAAPRSPDGAPQRDRGAEPRPVAPRRRAPPYRPEQGMTELRRRLLEDWPVKVVAVVFAVALWAFVVTEERTDAVFTVPLDLVVGPARVEVASVGVEAVVVRVEGRHSRLRRLHEEDFRAEVSLKSAQRGRFVARMDTDSVLAPSGVRVIRVTPTEVRAILEAR